MDPWHWDSALLGDFIRFQSSDFIILHIFCHILKKRVFRGLICERVDYDATDRVGLIPDRSITLSTKIYPCRDTEVKPFLVFCIIN